MDLGNKFEFAAYRILQGLVNSIASESKRCVLERVVFLLNAISCVFITCYFLVICFHLLLLRRIIEFVRLMQLSLGPPLYALYDSLLAGM
jgi:hypothetical protein